MLQIFLKKMRRRIEMLLMSVRCELLRLRSMHNAMYLPLAELYLKSIHSHSAHALERSACFLCRYVNIGFA